MAYSFQTYTVGQVLGASNMNQEEVNIRDHVHGASGVTATMRTITPETDNTYALGTTTLGWAELKRAGDVTDTTVVSYGNSGTETVVWSYALPASVLSSNRALETQVMYALRKNDANTNNLQTRFKYGTTTYAQVTLSFPATVNTGTILVAAILNAIGTTSLQGGAPLYETSQEFAANSLQMFSVPSFSTDSSTQQPISVTAQWGGASANTSVNKEVVRLIRIA